MQLVDVILTYAGGHREALYEALDQANGMDITTHSFKFLAIAPMLDGRDIGDDDYDIWTSWDNVVWDGISLAQQGGNARPVDRLKDIPTGYIITHADARLMAQAAHFLVKYMLP
ncbi:MAG: hypothetical protein ACSHWY_04745 [Octadecabacter sp.]